MSQRSSSLSHQLISYPSPRNYKITIAYAASQSMSKAAAVNIMIGKFIDQNFDMAQQQKLIQLFEKMDKPERKRPKKVDTDSKVIIAFSPKQSSNQIP